jgi:hypothetical protein
MASERKITSLQDHKRELLARSEVYRQTLILQAQELQSSVAWVPRAIGTAKSIGPLLAIIAPVAGLFFARKKLAGSTTTRHAPEPPRSKKGFLATALMGFQLYNRVRPILNAFTARQSHRHAQHHR